MSAKDFDPAVMALFDHGVHGRIDRRDGRDGASRRAGACAMAAR